MASLETVNYLGGSPKEVSEAINNNFSKLADDKAPVSNPQFSGIPTAPTAATDNNSQQIATTEFVHLVMDSAGGVPTFDTIAGVKNIKPGTTIKTRGYYAVGDGGAATYTVVAAATDLTVTTNDLHLLCDEKTVNYRMFGALLDGIADDEAVLHKTHKYANTYKLKVVNNSGTIYKASAEQILVETDVDLTGSTILMKNENVAYRSWYRLGKNIDVFESVTFTAAQIAQLQKGTSYFTMLDNSIKSSAVIKLRETNYCVRNDAGYFYPDERSELMYHDLHGICTGTLIEDWTNVTESGRGVTVDGEFLPAEFTASLTMYDHAQLVFSGCDVYIDTTPNVYVNLINVQRHNVLIKNFNIRPYRESMKNNEKFKNAVFFVEDSYNVLFDNITGFNIAGQDVGEVRGTSGYLLRLLCCQKVNVTNSRMNGYWGAVAINNSKDVHFSYCEMNRIDTHNYFRDLFINDCQMYNIGVQIGAGSGICSINNCSFSYFPVVNMSHMNNIVSLNSTYGRLFSGQLIIDNVIISGDYASNNDYNIIYCSVTDNVQTNSSEEYKLPEIRCRNILFDSSADTNLNMLHFYGTISTPANFVIKNPDLITLENISNKAGSVRLWQFINATNDTTNNLNISCSGVININETALNDNWFSGNVVPNILRLGVNNSSDGGNADTLGGKPASAFVLTSDPRMTNARLANGGNADTVGNKSVNDIVLKLATKIASGDLNDYFLGGYYTVPWDIINNPVESQGFLEIIPNDSDYSNVVQKFYEATSGKLYIRSSYWDPATDYADLAWTAWHTVTLDLFDTDGKLVFPNGTKLWVENGVVKVS